MYFLGYWKLSVWIWSIWSVKKHQKQETLTHPTDVDRNTDTKKKIFFLAFFLLFPLFCHHCPCCRRRWCLHVTCHLTPDTNTNSYSSLSIVCWLKIQPILKRRKKTASFFFLIVSFQANIMIISLAKSFFETHKCVFSNGTDRQTNTQTDRHSG